MIYFILDTFTGKKPLNTQLKIQDFYSRFNRIVVIAA